MIEVQCYWVLGENSSEWYVNELLVKTLVSEMLMSSGWKH